MSNRPLKGSVAEKAAEVFLTKDGWTVHRARAVMVNPAPGKFFVFSHDVWGVFDLVCTHPERGFLFVQVTTISGKTGSLNYGHVGDRKRKVEKLPLPPQMKFVRTAGDDVVDVRLSYRAQIWGARNQRKGRTITRWFQVWDFDVARRVWTQQPQRIVISGQASDVRHETPTSQTGGS